MKDREVFDSAIVSNFIIDLCLKRVLDIALSPEIDSKLSDYTYYVYPILIKDLAKVNVIEHDSHITEENVFIEPVS